MRSKMQPIGARVDSQSRQTQHRGAGAVGEVYSQTLGASGGISGYVWSITGGALQAGLTLNPATGAITGTPTAGGTSNITVAINPQNLSPGTYTGTITIGSQVAANLVIPVNLLVSTNPLLQVSSSTVTFNGSAGGTTPFTSQVTVSSSGSSLNW